MLADPFASFAPDITTFLYHLWRGWLADGWFDALLFGGWWVWGGGWLGDWVTGSQDGHVAHTAVFLIRFRVPVGPVVIFPIDDARSEGLPCIVRS